MGCRSVRFIFALLLAGWLAACATPIPEGLDQGSFVPADEVLVVQLARQGMDAFNRSRFIDAELYFRQALFVRPELLNLRLNLAVTLSRSGLDEEALDIYGQLLEQRPDFLAYHVGRAQALVDASRFAEAQTQYEKAFWLAYEASDMNSVATIARSLTALGFRLGDEELAQCYSGVVIGLRPTEAAEAVRHGRLLIARGYHQQALEFASAWAAGRNEELQPQLLHLRALASFGLGNFADALEYERLVGINAGADPASSFEMALVRKMSEQSLGILPDDEEDQDLQEAFFKGLVQILAGSGGVSLYWPDNLVSAASEAALSWEAEEQQTFWQTIGLS